MAQVDSANLLYEKYKTAWEANQFEDSKNHLLNLVERNYSVQSSYYGFIHNNLGRTYWKLGIIDSAEYHYKEAEKLCKDTAQYITYLLNSIYNNIALLYVQKGQYSVSLDFYRKSENILLSIKEKDVLYFNRLSALFLNRGIAYYKLGNNDFALESLSKARTLKKTHNQPFLGSVYFNLARVYQNLDINSLALENYRNSIEQWTKENDSLYFRLASIYLDYGQLLVLRNESSQGIMFYRRALENFLSNYGPKHIYTSNCYEYFARYYLEEGEYQMSLENVQLALISICPKFNNSSILSNPVEQASLLDIRLLKYYQLKVRALQAIVNSEVEDITIEQDVVKREVLLDFKLETIGIEIELLQKIRNGYLDKESRLYLAENQKNIFIVGIEAAFNLYNLTNDPNYLDKAYSIASIGKSLEFQFEFVEKKNLYLESSRDPLAKFILTQKEEIFSYQNMIHLEQQNLAPDSSLIIMWRDTLFSLKRNYENSVVQLWGDMNNPGNMKSTIAPDHLALTQKKLRKNETLIEYAISNNSREDNREMFTFVITKNDCHVINTKLDCLNSNPIGQIDI